MWWIKIRRDILIVKVLAEEQGVPDPQQAPQPKVLVPGRVVPITSCRKNQQGLCLSETEGCWSSREFLLKVPCTDLPGLTPFELQLWGSSSKGMRDLWEVQCQGKSWGESFLPDRSSGRGHCSFDEPCPHRAGRWVPYLSLHLPGSHNLTQSGYFLRLCPTQLVRPSKLFQWLFQ